MTEPTVVKKILLMDDNIHIRKTSKRMLEHLGYGVCLAKHGNEAITLYKKEQNTGHPFTAVILDLTIPGGMGGEEAIENLIKIDPEIKAIVSSDFSNSPIILNPQKYGFDAALIKPYCLAELSSVLNEILK